MAGGPHVLLDGVTGRGHYVGTYLAWGANSSGWWGEGEVKFYLDDDEEFRRSAAPAPRTTSVARGTSTCRGQGYATYSTPYLGLHQVLRPDGLYASQQRFGMYRWHLPGRSPFASRLRVDVQALGWRSGGRYLALHDDIASTAYFYLDAPGDHPPAGPDGRRDGDRLSRLMQP